MTKRLDKQPAKRQVLAYIASTAPGAENIRGHVVVDGQTIECLGALAAIVDRLQEIGVGKHLIARSVEVGLMGTLSKNQK